MITPPSWHKKPWTGCITLLSTEVGHSRLTKKKNKLHYFLARPVMTSPNISQLPPSQRMPTADQARGQALKGAEVQDGAAENRAALQHGAGKHLPTISETDRNWGCPGLSKIGDLGIPKSTKHNSPYTVLHRIAFGSSGKFCKHLPHLHNSRVAIGFQHALFQHLHLACEGDSDLILRL